MNCAFSKELLALHVENDLPDADARGVARHLRGCDSCRTFFDQLGSRQAQLKRLRCDAIHPAAFAAMRHGVLTRIENAPQSLGWLLRIERAMFLGFRRHAAVFAGLAIAAVVSVTLFAQMRQGAAVQKAAAVFAGGDRNDSNAALVRPSGYRDWISIGSSIGSSVGLDEELGPHGPALASSGSVPNVYLDRSAYRQFVETGNFPEGAVLVLEIFKVTDSRPAGLAVSVKDSRFDGGWGYFDFTNADGTIADQARPVLDKSACRSCHEERARFDHVFTQFHPVLKTAT